MSGEEWSREELILALDTYLNEGARGYEKENEVKELAQILPRRNAGAVSYKVSNFRNINSEDDVKGFKNHGKKDEEVWQEYRDDTEMLSRRAEELRIIFQGLNDTDLLEHDIYKFGGNIEQWLTTYHTGFWGLTEKARDDWEDCGVGDVALLHASKPDYLSNSDTQLRSMKTGIVGAGVVNGKSEKDDPHWLAEHQGESEWPLLVHFSEIYWFTDVSSIEDRPVDEKDEDRRLKESKAMLKGRITFDEIKDYTDGYSISQYGGRQNIAKPERMIGLIEERIRSSNLKTYGEASDDGVKDDELTEIEDSSDIEGMKPSILNIESPVPSNEEYENTKTEAKINKQSQREATYTHQETLKAFMMMLGEQGYSCFKTERSDLLAEDDDEIILAEVKSISSGNRRSQVRKALGQLSEYEYFDLVDRDWSETDQIGFDSLGGVEIRKVLVLSDEPDGSYASYMRYLTSEKDLEVLVKSGDSFETMG